MAITVGGMFGSVGGGQTIKKIGDINKMSMNDVTNYVKSGTTVIIVYSPSSTYTEGPGDSNIPSYNGMEKKPYYARPYLSDATGLDDPIIFARSNSSSFDDGLYMSSKDYFQVGSAIVSKRGSTVGASTILHDCFSNIPNGFIICKLTNISYMYLSSLWDSTKALKIAIENPWGYKLATAIFTITIRQIIFFEQND